MFSFRSRLVVDLISFLAGSVLVWTGALMWLILPPGSRGSSLWNWTRHDFGEVHQWAAMVLLGSILVHLFLNWAWLLGTLHKVFHTAKAPTRRRRLVFGTICFVLFFGGMAGTLIVANQQKIMTEEGRGRNRGGHVEVTPAAELSLLDR
jgi:hypothetical protein